MNLVGQLNTFRNTLLHHPHADETYAQWKSLEPHLSMTQQSCLLEAWNTYLTSPEADETIHMAFAAVIHELGPPLTRQSSCSRMSS